MLCQQEPPISCASRFSESTQHQPSRSMCSCHQTAPDRSLVMFHLLCLPALLRDYLSGLSAQSLVVFVPLARPKVGNLTFLFSFLIEVFRLLPCTVCKFSKCLEGSTALSCRSLVSWLLCSPAAVFYPDQL